MTAPRQEQLDEAIPPPPWISKAPDDGVRYDNEEAADHWNDQIWHR